MARPSCWAAVTFVATLGCGGGDEPDFRASERGSHEPSTVPEAPPEARCRGGDHAACSELGGSPDGANALGLAREAARYARSTCVASASACPGASSGPSSAAGSSSRARA